MYNGPAELDALPLTPSLAKAMPTTHHDGRLEMDADIRYTAPIAHMYDGPAELAVLPLTPSLAKAMPPTHRDGRPEMDTDIK